MDAPRALWSDSVGRPATRVLQFLIFAAGLAVVVWALTSQALTTLPILIAIILASALQPVLVALRRRGAGRIGSTAITFTGTLLLLIGIFTLVSISIYRQSDVLAARAVEGVTRLQDWLRSLGVEVDAARFDAIEKSLNSSSGGDLASRALHGVATAGEIGTGTLLTLVLLFFFLLDGDRMWTFIKRFIPARRRDEAHTAGVTSVKVLGAYVRGTVFIAAFAAIVDTVAMLVMGAPLAIPLGTLIFFGAFVPILGALVTGVLAALVTLVTLGPIPALVLVGIVILVNQIEHHILQPKVMGDSLGLHGSVILIALAIGAHTGGISGAIVAVPITAVVWAAVKSVMEGRGLYSPVFHSKHGAPASEADDDGAAGTASPEPRGGRGSHAAPSA
ncbi:AI-2E family transporter [Falsarthrobacter nasiphocae]|uniref:PurR-regulated permease PerM n=1 Tax=Falsarthrobacter nasiphocae TaxID=189863 RepID=A0AAE4C6G2_9MICC|nr:AI-2E family transporter [Falsarthrobacter nasiphocae]MDR6892132.1 putative PurR-regulated permease PerM [Falsarthrobacter nasiphocae]